MRTLTHDGREMARLVLKCDAIGTVDIEVGDYTTASVTLEPLTPIDTVAARLIAGATAVTTGEEFRVTVPGDPGGNTTVVQNARGTHVRMTSRTVTGSMTGVTITGNGNVVVGGNIVNGHVVNRNVVSGGGIQVTVRLPRTCTAVNVDTTSADVAVSGALRTIAATTLSGDVAIGTATETAHVNTTSGDVVIAATPDARVHTVSGDVSVISLAARAFLGTVSGDIRVHAVGDATVHAESVSGDIRLAANSDVTVRSNLRTVTGRVIDRTNGGGRR
ncbi:DUF4097 family beta strand repeat-containing protein [Amycolatopsis keratiniphila]|uniref:DUF4097 family beta strand repeat-containing protein n=1 Tax=Amycolatopsis keratiniphila TaxID=129921 RepID=UPI00087C4045|nr:DUF4097 family beta strand repeat-containing protein [Amycolatopsis keratiniphila]OLZ56088.1 hypothetical protein BS330_18325 [Amycolatopsis keratiniphila subsp. nogabecina]SDU51704.1 Putative adhesin [Amycolatopsis keratiniphila]